MRGECPARAGLSKLNSMPAAGTHPAPRGGSGCAGRPGSVDMLGPIRLDIAHLMPIAGQGGQPRVAVKFNDHWIGAPLGAP